MRPLPSHRVGLACLALFALAVPTIAAAQEPGTTSGQLLGLRVAPRPLALGGAYAALADDPLAMFHNPAALAVARGAVLAFQTLPLDADAGLAAAAIRLGPGALGMGLRFLDLGEIEVVEPDPTGVIGRPTGLTASAGDVAASLGYGLVVGIIRVGAVARVLHTAVADLSDSGAAFDVGVAAEPVPGLTLAAVLQNLGGELEAGRAASLPTAFRGAVGVALPAGDRVTARIGLEARVAEDRDALSGGLEMLYDAGAVRAMARAGIDGSVRSEDEAGPLVFGGGIELERFRLDYAYQTLGALGGSHHFSVGFAPQH